MQLISLDSISDQYQNRSQLHWSSSPSSPSLSPECALWNDIKTTSKDESENDPFVDPDGEYEKSEDLSDESNNQSKRLKDEFAIEEQSKVHSWSETLEDSEISNSQAANLTMDHPTNSQLNNLSLSSTNNSMFDVEREHFRTTHELQHFQLRYDGSCKLYSAETEGRMRPPFKISYLEAAWNRRGGKIAVKQVLKPLKESVDKFRRDYAARYHLQHANVVKFYQLFVLRESVFGIMENMDFGSLEDRILSLNVAVEGPMPAPEMYAICLGVSAYPDLVIFCNINRMSCLDLLRPRISA